MNIGIIIVCRYDSMRLPGKILHKIQGKEVLTYIYERLLKVKHPANIVIATSTEESDQPIVNFCKKLKIQYFQGDKMNVAKRVLDCAYKFNFDYFVRINGDNVFTDPHIIDIMLEIALEKNYDFVSNVKCRTFPSGMSVEIIKKDYYKEMFNRFSKPEHFEHVTLFLYETQNNRRHYYMMNDICPLAKNLHLALDDKGDLRFISMIIGRMKKPHTEYNIREIYDLSKNGS
jgi:spore coat polysaccharide biosynthesis protein SpsF